MDRRGVDQDKTKYLLGVIYRHSSSNINQYTDKFNTKLSLIAERKKKNES